MFIECNFFQIILYYSIMRECICIPLTCASTDPYEKAKKTRKFNLKIIELMSNYFVYIHFILQLQWVRPKSNKLYNINIIGIN